MNEATYVYEGWGRPIELSAGPDRFEAPTVAIQLPWGRPGVETKIILNAAQCRTLADLLSAVATGLEKKG